MKANCVHLLTLILIAELAALGWQLIAAIVPQGPPKLAGMLMIGFLIGTMFGQVSLAAGWCALGPLALAHRLPLAFGWLAAIVISLGLNMAQSSSSTLADLLMVGGAITGQFLLLQAVWWPVRARYGLRVARTDVVEVAAGHGEHQFEIRQLMMLTAIVAVALGAGRFALGGLKATERAVEWQGFLLFGFLALCSALMAIPLVAAALLKRRTLAAVGGAIVLTALVTALEAPLVNAIEPGPPSYETAAIVGLGNLFQCVWILGILALIRLAGYRLASKTREAAASEGG